MRKRLTIMCMILTTLVVAGFFWYHANHSIPVVEISSPQKKTLNSKVHCVGNLESQDTRYVTPTVGETVNKIYRHSGDQVLEGEILFSTLSPSSQKDYLAPISGIVGQSTLKEYGEAVPGFSFMQVISTDGLLVSAELDEIYLADIHEGQTVELTLDAYPTRSYTGTIQQITPYASASGGITGWLLDQGTPSVTLQIAIDGNTSDLIPGLSASGNIITKTEMNALLVPCTAVFSDGEEEYLFLYQDGKAYKRSITTGLYYDGYYQVTSGISLDDQIILNPSDQFFHGIKVMPHA